MKLRLYGKKPFIIAVVHGGPGARGSVALVAKEMSQYFGLRTGTVTNENNS